MVVLHTYTHVHIHEASASPTRPSVHRHQPSCPYMHGTHACVRGGGGVMLIVVHSCVCDCNCAYVFAFTVITPHLTPLTPYR